MSVQDRERVAHDLGHRPVVSRPIPGASSMHVERYRFQTIERTVAGLTDAVLVAHFGGGEVIEDGGDRARIAVLPSQTLLVPAGVVTHWHYSRAVDFAVFHLEAPDCPLQGALRRHVAGTRHPVSFGDPLVGALARQLVAEVQRGSDDDEAYLARLAALLLEQSHRCLTGVAPPGLLPRAHPAIDAVLRHIDAHLDDDLSAAALAARAGFSSAHFRRLFQQAVGQPPHRHVLARRLARARTLLAESGTSIAVIADRCGFSSQSHLTASFRVAHSIAPAEFRSRLQGRQKADRV